METKTKVIQIARVKRQNSSGDIVSYEQLFDGKPKQMRGYTMLDFWGVRSLQEGESFQSYVYGYFMKVAWMPLFPTRYTNVNGQLVRTLFWKP